MPTRKITSPDDPVLTELCSLLAEQAGNLDRTGDWPDEQLRLCGEYGVYEWFLEPTWGGQTWDEDEIISGYLALSAACLTTTFIITQRSGACRRIAGCENQQLKECLLPDLASGKLFATVGISHLTTSRQFLAKPVLRAERRTGGFLLDGFSPWVTGAAHAQYVVVAASMVDHDQPTGEQLLVALPTNLPGVTTPEPAQLVGLTASHTGELRLNQVEVDERWLVAGPAEDVMASGQGGTTGGLQTSTLALGLAHSAINIIAKEADRRDELHPPLAALRKEYEELAIDLFALVHGKPVCSNEDLRQAANSLALRAAQASLAAAKGTGYIVGHPAGRLCREALFFLVWSCPQPVLKANLCELAGILD